MTRKSDTLAAARDLEAAGIDRGHATAIVLAIGQAGDEVATKADLQPLATKAAVAALEARIEARIERAMNRNLLATVAVGGVIIAAVKLL